MWPHPGRVDTRCLPASFSSSANRAEVYSALITIRVTMTRNINRSNTNRRVRPKQTDIDQPNSRASEISGLLVTYLICAMHSRIHHLTTHGMSPNQPLSVLSANKEKSMEPITFPRIHGTLKAVSAMIGAGAVLTMGTVTLAGASSSAADGSSSGKAEYGVTLIPATRTQPSVKPQYLIDLCDWATNHMQLHHNC